MNCVMTNHIFSFIYSILKKKSKYYKTSNGHIIVLVIRFGKKSHNLTDFNQRNFISHFKCP